MENDLTDPDKKGPLQQPLGFLGDAWVTCALWAYFLFGFVLFFSPRYLWAALASRDRQAAFQRLNHRFYGGFFSLLKFLMPRCRWEIGPDVRETRGAVVVANHRSYLDPLLMISLFPRHTTIAKDRLFHIPVFGKMLAMSGYIPSTAGRGLADRMIRSIENLGSCLNNGGNLFIFPEGARSRSGAVAPFNRGAFKLARKFRAPIRVLFIGNTDRVYRPGRFLFHSGYAGTVRLEALTDIQPDYDAPSFSIDRLMADVRAILVERGQSAFS